MIDTHCHLTDPRLRSQLDGVLARAAAAGVDRIITVGTSLADSRDTIALCRERDNVQCVVGVHPNYTSESELSDIAAMRDLATHPAVAALGEMGLDYHYPNTDRDRQAHFFRAQLALAVELDRRVVIHSRDAIDDTLAILAEFSAALAVFHCFTGSPAEARRILAAGHWLSFTGAATFKNADPIRQAIALTPRDRLMIETDAPYLTPEPMRKQKTNEPAMVTWVAKQVAQVWNVPVEEVDRITTENAERFFRLRLSPIR